ncbi:hypothetical protein QCM77_45780, partial [Bradyrhizobium sp. SSUT18]|uniref:hypothetical protein n=1 Tax=Bradyrhizobium sp. SSUT18 TaxID=3040602 RepID=UPI00244D7C66
ALTTAPRIKPTSIFLRSARRPNTGRVSTYRRGIFVQTIGTGSLFHFWNSREQKDGPNSGQWAVKLGPIGVALGEGHRENSAICKAFRLPAVSDP